MKRFCPLILILCLVSLAYAVDEYKMNPHTGKLDNVGPFKYYSSLVRQGGGGHTIRDSAGNSKPARGYMRYSSPFVVTDDAGKNETRFSIPFANQSTAGLMSAGSKKQQGISVEEYGAVLNGTTDDSTAINNAITALYNKGGGTVYIPQNKIAAIAAPIIIRDKVILECNWSFVKWTGGAAGTMFTTDTTGYHTRYAGIQNVKVWITANVSRVFDMQSYWHSYIRNVEYWEGNTTCQLLRVTGGAALANERGNANSANSTFENFQMGIPRNATELSTFGGHNLPYLGTGIYLSAKTNGTVYGASTTCFFRNINLRRIFGVGIDLANDADTHTFDRVNLVASESNSIMVRVGNRDGYQSWGNVYNNVFNIIIDQVASYNGANVSNMIGIHLIEGVDNDFMQCNMDVLSPWRNETWNGLTYTGCQPLKVETTYIGNVNINFNGGLPNNNFVGLTDGAFTPAFSTHYMKNTDTHIDDFWFIHDDNTVILSSEQAHFRTEQNNLSAYRVDAHTGTNTAGASFETRQSRGSKAIPSATQVNDMLGAFKARGYGATGWAPYKSAGIVFNATENYDDTHYGGKITFQTVENGTSGPSAYVDALVLNHNGAATFANNVTAPAFIGNGAQITNTSGYKYRRTAAVTGGAESQLATTDLNGIVKLTPPSNGAYFYLMASVGASTNTVLLYNAHASYAVNVGVDTGVTIDGSGSAVSLPASSFIWLSCTGANTWIVTGKGGPGGSITADDKKIIFSDGANNPTGAALYWDKTNLRLGNVASPATGIEWQGNTTQAQIRLTDTTTSSSTNGASYRLYVDDGAAMASGDRLGLVVFGGARDAAHALSAGARIDAYSEGTWDGTNTAGKLCFLTAATVAGGPLERICITSDGRTRYSNQLSAPANNAACTVGDTVMDAANGFMYLCTATNSWKRATFSSY